MFGNFFVGKNVFITGHTGFKGSWLSLWLNKLGAKVVGYALKPPTDPNFFDVCHLSDKMISILGDIRDGKNLSFCLQKYQPEIVFHLAAQPLVRESYKNPVDTYDVNIMGTVHLLEACRYVESIKTIVNITSDKCYENIEQEKRYSEEDRLGGRDPYSSSKACCELVTKAYVHSFLQSKIFVASARAGNVIGGGDWAQDRLLPDTIKSIMQGKEVVIRNPDAIRPWQHVLEPLCGYLILAKKLYESGAFFSGGWNFGPEKESEKKVRYIMDYLINKWQKGASWKIDDNIHPYEAKFLSLDNSKSKMLLGWEPRWNLEEALSYTIEWYGAYYSTRKDMQDFSLYQIEQYEKEMCYANM